MSDITIGQIWKSMNANPGSGGLYRPIACLSLALNWYVGQDKVFGYHVVNWLIHLGTCWLLFLTISALFRTPQLHTRYSAQQISFIAITATLFWALNPVQTQAITYIVQRMASLATFFSLLAIYCYLHGRLSQTRNRQIFFTAGAFSYILAILSKENSIILPLTIPILEIFFFHAKISPAITKKLIISLLVGLFVSFLAAVALYPAIFDFIPHYYAQRPYTMLERVLTEQRILLFYLTQLFFPLPSRLSIAHDFPLSTSLFTPWDTAAAIFINLLFILLALKIGRKKPFIALAILFFYLHHLIESTILPLELIFEHRNYLPSLFLFIPLAILINNLILQVKHNKILFTSSIILISTIFAVEGYATFTRNKVWESETSLWLDALRKAPNSDRPLAVLALKIGWGEHSSEQDYKKALRLVERSLTMVKSRKLADAAQLGNAGSLYHKLGNYQKSIEYYNRALKLIPDDISIRFNMAKTFISAGNFMAARKELYTILEHGSTHPDYFHLIGFSDLWLGNPERAAISLRKAMRMAPGQPDILLALGKSLSLTGYYTRARWFLDMAREHGGENPIISLCLIENCLLQQDEKLAKAYLQHALRHHTLPSILETLTTNKTQYQTVPINADLLLPFIAREVKTFVSH